MFNVVSAGHAANKLACWQLPVDWLFDCIDSGFETAGHSHVYDIDK